MKAAGRKIISENRDIGVATVRAGSASFGQQAGRESALVGAARDISIGQVPHDARPRDEAIEKAIGDGLHFGAQSSRRPPRPAQGPPPGRDRSRAADPHQWDMRMIGATPVGSYHVQQGSHAVRVGIIDTGID